LVVDSTFVPVIAGCAVWDRCSRFALGVRDRVQVTPLGTVARISVVAIGVAIADPAKAIIIILVSCFIAVVVQSIRTCLVSRRALDGARVYFRIVVVAITIHLYTWIGRVTVTIIIGEITVTNSVSAGFIHGAGVIIYALSSIYQEVDAPLSRSADVIGAVIMVVANDTQRILVDLIVAVVILPVA
jgi:hypothetical protein